MDLNLPPPQAIETIYRAESGRVLATLIRLLGDFDLVEEAMQEAFAAALRQWPQQGVPRNPRAWLISTGRFKAIDSLRRKARFDSVLPDLLLLDESQREPETAEDEGVADDQLRLIFTCCHPSLAPEAQVALTLREVCGLSTGEIAHAFLTNERTIAQRIVRAKAKIRVAKIPYKIPELADLPARLDNVLQVLYLVYNEGYSASSGESLIRRELTDEAIRLGRLLLGLQPDAEVMGLLALMLIQDSRRRTRTDAEGGLVLLEDQDRGLWDQELIREGATLIRRALLTRNFGHFTLQAAIASVHAETTAAAETDWVEIVGIYDLLIQADPSPVVALNRAAAIAMRDGPQAGLDLIKAILERGDLVDYAIAHAAWGDLHQRIGQIPEAILAYQKARELAKQGPLARFLDQRLQALTS